MAGVLFVLAETDAAATKFANCVLYVVAEIVAGESKYMADNTRIASTVVLFV